MQTTGSEGVRPAAVVARGEPEREPDRERDRLTAEPHGEREPRAEQHAAQHVAPLRVGAEEIGCRGRP